MPKYEATLKDGRVMHVHAKDESTVEKQVTHAEMTRVVIATKRNHPIGPDVSSVTDIRKVKD